MRLIKTHGRSHEGHVSPKFLAYLVVYASRGGVPKQIYCPLKVKIFGPSQSFGLASPLLKRRNFIKFVLISAIFLWFLRLLTNGRFDEVKFEFTELLTSDLTSSASHRVLLFL